MNITQENPLPDAGRAAKEWSIKTGSFQLVSIVLIGLLLLIGCTKSELGATTITATHIPIATTSLSFSTITPTHSPTVTRQHTASPVLTNTQKSSRVTTLPRKTPLPTLSEDESRSAVTDLFENNAGCRLPCWWGLVPGKTLWTDAEHFLSQFALFMGKYYPVRSENQFYVDVQIPTPLKQVDSSWVDISYLTQDYFVKDGAIETIEIFNYDLVPAYSITNFLQMYGQPDGVWIRTFREEEQNSQPFLVDFFYENQGILMEYSGGELVDLGDRLRNCLDKQVDSPFIYLWSPDKPLTFEEATETFLDTENSPEPIPVKDATGIDTEEFYENILISGVSCIETPKELWP